MADGIWCSHSRGVLYPDNCHPPHTHNTRHEAAGLDRHLRHVETNGSEGTPSCESEPEHHPTNSINGHTPVRPSAHTHRSMAGSSRITLIISIFTIIIAPKLRKKSCTQWRRLRRSRQEERSSRDSQLCPCGRLSRLCSRPCVGASAEASCHLRPTTCCACTECLLCCLGRGFEVDPGAVTET